MCVYIHSMAWNRKELVLEVIYQKLTENIIVL